MELVNRHRPHRSVIRCKAKMQLLETNDDCLGWREPLDDALLKELAVGLFQAAPYRIFFEKGHSKAEVKAVEAQLAQELAETYRSISKRCQDPLVQSLNALL
ncbi:hypothetical protein IQ254_15070 [Nodosilinea sp. LEGE 07088]|uniref:hypothetical protein n=1 Tax=Nodosilinea sp. LEGE 07088 TaxID=2777968 RepID=UPI00187E412C|nr:hypothetical protein [Nodosilinea sp. LEGE 07088]MBE9138495.1 hypothetical protein [Nodosilinea sp. LEGE 07088]